MKRLLLILVLFSVANVAEATIKKPDWGQRVYDKKDVIYGKTIREPLKEIKVCGPSYPVLTLKGYELTQSCTSIWR